MDLLRVWRRKLLGGAAVAGLVPAAIVVAALGVGAAGGLGGLDSLMQALTGPQIPEIEPLGAGDEAEADDAGTLISSISAAEAEAAPAPVRITRPRRTARRRSREGDRPGARPAPGTTRPPSGGGGGAPPPPPPPPEPPSTVRQVGDTVKQVTDDVPVAGEPAGQVVDLLVETAESLPVPLP